MKPAKKAPARTVHVSQQRDLPSFDEVSRMWDAEEYLRPFRGTPRPRKEPKLKVKTIKVKTIRVRNEDLKRN